MQNITHYTTLVFDCDGVILNSNQVKIQAYFDTAISYGADQMQAQALVDYHVKLGGISRFVKFDYFLAEILKKPADEAEVQWLLDEFGRILDYELMHCELAPHLHKVKQATLSARWMLVSGGDQHELRHIFSQRGIADLFEAGIFGSPDNKDEILKRETSNGNLKHPALFIGDSRYDHQASTNAGLDFVFLSDWTDVPEWQGYCKTHQIHVEKNIGDLLEYQ